MINPRRRIRHALLTINGYIGKAVSVASPQKVTILLTFYHAARMNHIDSQVRNFLKCTFVDQIVITNHNPNIKIEDKINVRDDRLICINQVVRRGNGHRWRVANTLDGEYFIVIDDDVLLFPDQLKILFQHLISEPAIPHGFTGQIHGKNDVFEYRERENIEVDYLCELYAVSKYHVQQYAEIERIVSEQDKTLAEFVERFADHIVISQTTDHRPKIHAISRLLRSETFNTPGIATHKDDEFEASVLRVCRAVKRIKKQLLVGDRQTTKTQERI
jgi:hypothetical protein